MKKKLNIKDVCPARSVKGKDAYDSRAQSGVEIRSLLSFRELDSPTTNTKDKTWTIKTSMRPLPFQFSMDWVCLFCLFLCFLL